MCSNMCGHSGFYFNYICMHLRTKILVFSSGFRLASAKAAKHRLDRGVWTSVNFGDMRRALSGMCSVQLIKS